MLIKVIFVTLTVVMVTQSKPGKLFKELTANWNINKNVKEKRNVVASHPCDNAVRDKVIHTGSGDIVCLRPTDRELNRQLRDTGGGFNHHYLASTLENARSGFKNMFAVYGSKFENTTQWKAWVTNDNSISSSPYIRDSQIYSLAIKKRVKDRMNTIKQRLAGGRSKREYPTPTTIQCLPGGRLTEKGIHLCPACQRCTEMPEYFYPRYINELTCDNTQSGVSNNVGCYLSSKLQIGTCQQITMTLNLLVHKNGKYVVVFTNATMTKYQQVYEPITHELRTCCECMVYSSLISG